MIINKQYYPIEVRTHNKRNEMLIIDKSKQIKLGYPVLTDQLLPKTTTQDNLNVNYSNVIKWQNMSRDTKRLVAFVLLQMGHQEPLNYFNNRYMKG